MSDEFEGQDICVLGGTGTIGTALIERILESHPKRVRCVSNDEYSMWRAEKKFGPAGDGNPIRYVLKDIRGRHAMREVLRGVDILYMLAAYKHVQYVEYSPQEAIDVNIIGNTTIIDEAIQNGGIHKVVNVSTDKVCYSVSTYGLSKYVVEKVVEWASFYRPEGERRTLFANVRFGNVLMSRGSVLERWLDPKVGSIELRDPAHRRFFMPLRDSVDLIVRCTEEMRGGETFITRMPVMEMGTLAQTISDITRKPVVPIPKLLGESRDQWLMMHEESVHRKEDERGFVLHRKFPEVPPREYSTADETPLTREEIRDMLEKEEIL